VTDPVVKPSEPRPSEPGPSEHRASGARWPSPQRTSVMRWLPLALLLAGMAVALTLGWHKVLSFKTIGLNYHELKSYIAGAPLLALGLFMLAYIAVVTLALPFSLLMTITGGLLFGCPLGAAASAVGATIGATALFLIVKTSLGSALADKAGPFVARLSDGFRANALSYLLFLRLVPAFPFFVVNLVAALIGVPLATFVVGTMFGIIPGTVAYALAGAGLGSAVEAQNALYHACIAGPPVQPVSACPYMIDFKSLVTPELVWGGVAIGLVALIPAILKLWSRRHAAA
jgi:uncharacterized membrane protein YdjX (TVP38/TMEM64 family)